MKKTHFFVLISVLLPLLLTNAAGSRELQLLGITLTNPDTGENASIEYPPRYPGIIGEFDPGDNICFAVRYQNIGDEEIEWNSYCISSLVHNNDNWNSLSQNPPPCGGGEFPIPVSETRVITLCGEDSPTLYEWAEPGTATLQIEGPGTTEYFSIDIRNSPSYDFEKLYTDELEYSWVPADAVVFHPEWNGYDLDLAKLGSGNYTISITVHADPTSETNLHDSVSCQDQDWREVSLAPGDSATYTFTWPSEYFQERTGQVLRLSCWVSHEDPYGSVSWNQGRSINVGDPNSVNVWANYWGFDHSTYRRGEEGIVYVNLDLWDDIGAIGPGSKAYLASLTDLTDPASPKLIASNVPAYLEFEIVYGRVDPEAELEWNFTIPAESTPFINRMQACWIVNETRKQDGTLYRYTHENRNYRTWPEDEPVCFDLIPTNPTPPTCTNISSNPFTQECTLETDYDIITAPKGFLVENVTLPNLPSIWQETVDREFVYVGYGEGKTVTITYIRIIPSMELSVLAIVALSAVALFLYTRRPKAGKIVEPHE